MAAYTDNHHSFCNHLSLSQGLSSGTQHHNQDVSISELVDHGSISFGRFGGESLAWEKWSVFSHNRCQEELEKFKAPGLVAQKKAFFEEYYKKIRAMKKLQAEQQEIEKSNLSQENNNITHVETSDQTTEPEEEKNCSDSIQTFCSSDEQSQNPNDNVIINNMDETETSSATFVDEEPGWNPNGDFNNRDEIEISSATIVDEEQGQTPNCDIINGDEIKISSATIVDEEPSQNPNCDIVNMDEIETSSATIVDEEPGQNPNCDIIINRDDIETSSAAIVEKTCVKPSFQNSFDSCPLKINANRSKDLAVLSKAKATVTSARDKMKLDYRSKKDDIIKRSKKQKGSLDKDRSGKSTSQVLGEKANPKLTKTLKPDYVSSHRPSTNVRSSAIPSQISVIKDRPTSSHSVRSGLPKANLNTVSVTKDRPSSSCGVRNGVPKANFNSVSVTKDRPTSSHSVRHGVPKANLNSVSVTKNRPSSSFGVRSGVPKANLNSVSVIKDRPTSSYGVRSGVPKANLNSPLFVRSGVPNANLNSSTVRTGAPQENLNSKGSTNKIQATSKPKTVTNCVDNVGSAKRSHVGFLEKSLETVPKRGLPENQKPKVGLTSSPARIKSKQNPVNESGLKNNISKGGSKTKILAWQSADMTQARRELRPKTPGWR